MAKTYTNPFPKKNNVGIVVSLDGTSSIRKSITIESFSDNTIHKVVLARTDDGIYTLWSDATYDSIGNWTNEQAIDRLKELVLANKKQ